MAPGVGVDVDDSAVLCEKCRSSLVLTQSPCPYQYSLSSFVYIGCMNRFEEAEALPRSVFMAFIHFAACNL
jgi:hypothetical protein